ncbi:uncharacterized protein LOC122219236 isoform X2 [Panthera leo]|uniref:uncharacterized protein LOC122219236 isoform X2 n=1 Tax=Panthera leo TaxID=9689 RepID=UPI001C697236|nr:uncharacterized protein LOC122219236 isoform X2 [Panthera leo]
MAQPGGHVSQPSRGVMAVGDSAGKAPRETWGGISHRAAGPTSTISRLPALSPARHVQMSPWAADRFQHAQQAVLTQGCADPAVLHSEKALPARTFSAPSSGRTFRERTALSDPHR